METSLNNVTPFKHCKNCGKKLSWDKNWPIPRYIYNGYCSIKCKRTHTKKVKCKQCKKIFATFENMPNPTYKLEGFCSINCRKIFKKSKLNKICPTCGKQIDPTTSSSLAEYKRHTFCCFACARKASRKKPIICIVENCKERAIGRKLCRKHYDKWIRHGDPNYIRPKTEIKEKYCLFCGKKLTPSKTTCPKTFNTKIKYCSNSCGLRYMAKLRYDKEETRICKNCGKEMKRSNYIHPNGRVLARTIFAKKKFCSRKCFFDYVKDNKKS